MSSHRSQLATALGITGLVSFYGIMSLLIWFLGPSIGLDIYWQIILIALLLLTWPFAVLINHFRKRRAARKASVSAIPTKGEPSVAKTAPKRVYDELARDAEEA